MGRSIGKALAFAIIIATALTALPGRPAAAAPDEEWAARQADQALLDAIGKKAKKSAGRLLDSQFTWTDLNGKTRSKVDSLRVFATLGMDPGDTEVESHFYGQVFT